MIATKHPKMDVVIVRENEEDLYAGIEHMQTDQVIKNLNHKNSGYPTIFLRRIVAFRLFK